MWHRHPDSSDDAMVPASWPVTLTRDDLVRLVVGMQWVEAMRGHHVTVGEIFDGTYFAGSFHPNVAGTFDLRPAVDIVDEWLGAR